ncbi:iron transporter [Schaalia georgiae]|uniref:iron transporter n=1 Tax=Schaalia georgiae TaxID=52768 RepID=UPI0004049FFC|nr:iron transporter [Schaalia georgiae]
MKRSLARIGAAAAAIALAGTLAACSSNSNNSNNNATPPASQSADDGAKPGEDAGFEELPLGDDVFVGPLKVGGVYFQPVDMEPAMSTPAKDSSMHMEADISAVADNDLGYGAGDFIPALTVDYQIADKSGTVVQEGTFMPMNASDGPHYGINLPKLEAGTYDVTFMITSPEKNGWLLHTDEKTGVKGRFWKEPLKAEFKDWQWDPTSVDW